MTTFTGTKDAEAGLYLNLKHFSVAMLERRGPLPGTPDDTYRRVPVLLMLAAAPLVGLAYVIFLPFIGFAAVATLVGGKALKAADAFVDQAGWARRPRAIPAFFNRKNAAPPEHQDDVQDDASLPK